MRIEILVGLENPVFYPINKSKTIIGSDLSCDIVVSEDQISRKHLIILKEEDDYFVIDQGSTNGSYLNEERLIPGRRVEFTSYFPVRLGSSVLVSLVSDEDAIDEANSINIPFPGESSAPRKDPRPAQTPAKPPREADEQTRVVSLRDLQQSSTGSMVKRREAYKKKLAQRAKAEAGPKKKKKKGKKKKKKFLEFYEMVAIGIIGLALYFTYLGDDKVAPPPENVSTQKVANVEEKPEEKVLPKSPSLLELFELKDLPKCGTPEEKLLCDSLKPTSQPWAGAIKKGNQIIALIDGESFLREAEKIVPFPKDKSPSDPEAIEVHQLQVMEVASGLFIAQGFESEEFLKIKDHDLVFALLGARNGIYLVELSFAISPELLQFSRKVLTPARLSQLRQMGAEVMFFRKNIYDLVF